MSSRRSTVRTFAALSLPLALLLLGAVASSDSLAGLFTTAAVLSLIVMFVEATIDGHRRPSIVPSVSAPIGPGDIYRSRRRDTSSRSLDLTTARLIEVFAFVGTSTPTLIGLARSGGPSVLPGWLDLVSHQISRAFGMASVGVMIVRETLALGDMEFQPLCQVEFVGGSQRCTLPPGSRIPLQRDLASDIADSVGARSIYLASSDWTEQRRWVCLTFTVPTTHDLLEPLCKVMVAPISGSPRV